MIKARHHWLYVKFFRYYTRFMLRWHFRKVDMDADIEDKGLPVLLIGNHFSWWDGFFANYLNDQVFSRKFHVMMLEEQLQKRMFLNKGGAFSIRKHSPSVVETIRYTRQLLSDPANLVTMYPQGAINSMFNYPVRFEKGPEKMLRGLEKDVQVFFVIALIDYFSHTRPTVTLALREYDPGSGIQIQDMEQAFNSHLKDLIEQQKEQTG